MGLLRVEASRSLTLRDRRDTYVQLRGVGVAYSRDVRRDDFQSLVYGSLLRRRRGGQIWALRGVDFGARSGDVVGIIGPNGAGKTTLCRVIAGLLQPDEGEVEVRGSVFSLLSLGTGFNPELSGRENARLNALTLGFSAADVRQLLPKIEDFAELGEFFDQPLKVYSSGMRARLAFSVAAMANPEILIVDEALSVGDTRFSAKAAAKMQELVQHASLVIVVSHQLEFVQKYCTRVVWMEKGRVRVAGSPVDIVDEYRASVPRSVPRVVQTVQLRETLSRSSNTPVVVAEEVGVKYPLRGGTSRESEFWPLRDVSFTVNQGDILGIIGRNGAGKTTLCRVLSGILRPDRGRLRVFGATSALLTLGTGFNHQLTGRDNIFLNGSMLGIPKARLLNVFDEIVEFAELGDFIDQPVKNYSRGMISRLGFSIAATIQPDVFIVDEALAVGDLAFYQKASAKLQELMDRAKAVIVVTHDMSFVRTVCTRAIWLHRGTVRAVGEAKAVVAAYSQSC